MDRGLERKVSRRVLAITYSTDCFQNYQIPNSVGQIKLLIPKSRLILLMFRLDPSGVFGLT